MNLPMQVAVCWVRVPDHALDAGVARGLMGQLSAAERSRAERLQSAVSQRAYLGSHVLMRGMLARRLGLAPTMVPITSEAGGRPVVAGSGLVISLSHCDGLGVCAVAERGFGEIGVDAEPASAVRHLDEIVAEYLTPAEQRALPEAGDARHDVLVRLWTAKEAVLKVRGTGLVSLGSVECQTENGRLVSPLETTAGEWILTWRLPTRHYLALAGASSSVPPGVTLHEIGWQSLLA